MNVEDFKSIFYMEWVHRMLGRLIGVVFAVPYIYLLARRQLPGPLKHQLGGLGIFLGAQGALGWYMVKSGLEEQIIHDNAVPRVSQYRLAAHLGTAFLFYIGCMKFGLAIRRDAAWAKGGLVSGMGDGFLATLNNPAIRKFKRAGGLLFTLVLLTVISGKRFLWLYWVLLTHFQVHSLRA
jgi:cytochrome c oxidase assembly protein subunit 15